MTKREHTASCVSLATFTDRFGRDRGACTCGADEFNAGMLHAADLIDECMVPGDDSADWQEACRESAAFIRLVVKGDSQ